MLFDERSTRHSRVDEATFVASNLEVVRLHRPVGAVLHFKIPQNVLLGDRLYMVVDGRQDPLSPFGGKMDVVVHVFAAEAEVVEADESRADFVGAPLYFRAKKASLVSLRSVRRGVGSGIDEEYGLAGRIRVRLEDGRQLVRLGFRSRFEMAEIIARHVLADHDDDDFRVREYRRVIVNVVGDVANLSAGNDVESSSRGVGGVSED